MLLSLYSSSVYYSTRGWNKKTSLVYCLIILADREISPAGLRILLAVLAPNEF